MRYVSLDLETTGLRPDDCNIIEIGAVLETGNSTTAVVELPVFHCYVVRDSYCGQPYALSMHPIIFRRIAQQTEGYSYLWPREVGPAFKAWLLANGYTAEKSGRVEIICSGKNFASFDRPFLERLDKFTEHIKIAHRSLDPAILYVESGDEKPPGMETCLKRAGLCDMVTHTAVDDARQVVQLLRHKGL